MTPNIFINRKFQKLQTIKSKNKGKITLTDNVEYICDKAKINLNGVDIDVLDQISELAYYGKTAERGDTGLFDSSGDIKIIDIEKLSNKFSNSVNNFKLRYKNKSKLELNSMIDELGRTTFVVSLSDDFQNFLKQNNKFNKTEFYNAINASMNSLINKIDPEGEQNYYWYGGIHDNTEHLHAHITMFAETPRNGKYGLYINKSDNQQQKNFMMLEFIKYFSGEELKRYQISIDELERKIKQNITYDFIDDSKIVRIADLIYSSDNNRKSFNYEKRNVDEQKLIDEVVSGFLQSNKNFNKLLQTSADIRNLYKKYGIPLKNDKAKERATKAVRSSVMQMVKHVVQERQMSDIVRYFNHPPTRTLGFKTSDYQQLYMNFLELRGYDNEIVSQLTEKKMKILGLKYNKELSSGSAKNEYQIFLNIENLVKKTSKRNYLPSSNFSNRKFSILKKLDYVLSKEVGRVEEEIENDNWRGMYEQ